MAGSDVISALLDALKDFRRHSRHGVHSPDPRSRSWQKRFGRQVRSVRIYDCHQRGGDTFSADGIGGVGDACARVVQLRLALANRAIRHDRRMCVSQPMLRHVPETSAFLPVSADPSNAIVPTRCCRCSYLVEIARLTIWALSDRCERSDSEFTRWMVAVPQNTTQHRWQARQSGSRKFSIWSARGSLSIGSPVVRLPLILRIAGHGSPEAPTRHP